MSKLCVYCGEPLDDEGVCENVHTFKKMCINCAYCTEELSDDENGTLFCGNEVNKKNALNKMLETLKKEGGGYAVKTLEIEPLPLKKPTLKCSNWELRKDILDSLTDLFV